MLSLLSINNINGATVHVSIHYTFVLVLLVDRDSHLTGVQYSNILYLLGLFFMPFSLVCHALPPEAIDITGTFLYGCQPLLQPQ